MLRRAVLAVFAAALLVSSGCQSEDDDNPTGTAIAITNKIASIPAGQVHSFSVVVQNDGGSGYVTTLSGAGAIVETSGGPKYFAPAAQPSPNTVTIRVTAANGSGVYDTNTFTIDPPPGPVVSLTP